MKSITQIKILRSFYPEVWNPLGLKDIIEGTKLSRETVFRNLENLNKSDYIIKRKCEDKNRYTLQLKNETNLKLIELFALWDASETAHMESWIARAVQILKKHNPVFVMIYEWQNPKFLVCFHQLPEKKTLESIETSLRFESDKKVSVIPVELQEFRKALDRDIAMDCMSKRKVIYGFEDYFREILKYIR